MSESVGETLRETESMLVDLGCIASAYPDAMLVRGHCGVYRVDSLPEATGVWLDEEHRVYPCVRIGACAVIEKTYCSKAAWYVLHRLLEMKPELLGDVLKAVRG